MKLHTVQNHKGSPQHLSVSGSVASDVLSDQTSNDIPLNLLPSTQHGFYFASLVINIPYDLNSPAILIGVNLQGNGIG